MNERVNSVASSQEELATRIKTVVNLYGSRKSAAEAAGVSTDMLSRYMRGESQPGFVVISNLCRPVGVSLAWVADGQGTMRLNALSDTEKQREDIYLERTGDNEAAERNEARFQEVGERVRNAGLVAQRAANSNGLNSFDQELIRTVAFAMPEDQDFVASLIERLSSDGDAYELSQEFALIPGYSIQVAAGVGYLPGNEKPSRKLAFRRKWLRFRGLNEKDLVLVFAKGDSMEPTISDNNTLMIDTSQRELTDGSIYVIRTDHHLIVKRVQTLWNKGILLLSDNKEYKEQLVEPSEADDLEVIGRVVWIGKDV
ncbi:XRE family transcriptional regulator [Marinobacterium sp. MBR-109]|jgi:phage repressor protein C with HTH and peptisase S24 domain|uniref:XRE family transcriptional regulator n=1 Tax=Marinobacterium sp. MBR-109 TaxID=3156462 RepID=UPI00339A6687